MKAEKNQSKIKGSNVGTVVTAFATGAAAGLAVGVLLTSNKGSKLRDKLKNLLTSFNGVAASVVPETDEQEVRPAGYTQDTDDKQQDTDDKKEYYDT